MKLAVRLDVDVASTPCTETEQYSAAISAAESPVQNGKNCEKHAQCIN